MYLAIGTEVQVSVPERSQMPNNPIRALNGKSFIIKSRRTIRKDKSTSAAYYELYGAKSKFDIPYVFLEEDLIVL